MTFLDGIVSGAKNTASGVVNATKSAVRTVEDAASDVVNTTGSAIDTVTGAADTASDILDSLSQRSSNSDTCPSIKFSGRLNSTLVHVRRRALPFENTPSIVESHLSTPRFGHTKNVTAVIEGNKADTRDYMTGVAASSIIIFCFFVVWVILLFAFRCLGPNRVGFLAGAKKKKPSPSSSNEEASSKTSTPEESPPSPGECHLKPQDTNTTAEDKASASNTDPAWRKDRRIFRMRIAVIISAVAVVVLCILMIVYGVDHLYDALNKARAGIREARDLSLQGSAIVKNFVDAYDATMGEANNLQLEQTCPRLHEVVCGGAGSNNCLGIADQVGGLLHNSSRVLLEQNNLVRDELQTAARLLNQIDQQASEFNWAFWVAAAAAACLALLNLVIVVKVVAMMRNKPLPCGKLAPKTSKTGITVGVSLYILLLIIMWAFLTTFLIGTTISGDVCYNSPDQRMKSVIRYYRKDGLWLESFLLDFMVDYMSSSCPANGPDQTMLASVEVFVDGLTGIDSSLKLVEDNSYLGSVACNVEAQTIVNATGQVRRRLCDLSAALFDVAAFFNCSKWNRLYTTIMYDAVCYEGTRGMSWLVLTQFLVVLLSMVVITLRLAIFSGEVEEDASDGEKGNSTCDVEQPKGIAGGDAGSASGEEEDDVVDAPVRSSSLLVDTFEDTGLPEASS